MEISFLFKIAGIGLIVVVMQQILSRAGREEIATLTVLTGIIIIVIISSSILDKSSSTSLTSSELISSFKYISSVFSYFILNIKDSTIKVIFANRNSIDE